MNLLGIPDQSHAEPAWSVEWAARTDVGAVRELNQDAAVVGPYLMAVADGMGGHEAGEVASEAVVTRLHPLVDQLHDFDQLVAALRDAVADMAAANVPDAGTTVTGVRMVSPDRAELQIFNIGDSRVYVYQAGVLTRLTRDDSLVQDMVDQGQLSAEEAETHPLGNVVTRSVGMLEDPLPSVTTLLLTGTARLLVCSDGLTKELNDRELVGYLSEGTASEAADQLLAAALHNEARDNVTLIVMDVTVAETGKS